MSPKHQEALAHLYFSLSGSNRFVLLTGEVGTGKTTLCRGLLDELPEDVDMALILNPRISSVELLAAICDELGVDYPRDSPRIRPLVDRLTQYLLDASERGRRTFVIIDEAQNLDVDVLEEVRLLTNIETSTDKLLQIILVGQPELRDKLALPELRQLSQRITARYHLAELGPSEIEAYLRHRLSVVGCSRRLFDSGAIKALYKASGGVPRLINSIADRALTGAFVQELDMVNKRTVRQAAREILGERDRNEVPHVRLALISLLVMLVSAGASYLVLNHWWQSFNTNSDVMASTPPEQGEVAVTLQAPMAQRAEDPSDATPVDAAKGTPADAMGKPDEAVQPVVIESAEIANQGGAGFSDQVADQVVDQVVDQGPTEALAVEASPVDIQTEPGSEMAASFEPTASVKAAASSIDEQSMPESLDETPRPTETQSAAVLDLAHGDIEQRNSDADVGESWTTAETEQWPDDGADPEPGKSIGASQADTEVNDSDLMTPPTMSEAASNAVDTPEIALASDDLLTLTQGRSTAPVSNAVPSEDETPVVPNNKDPVQSSTPLVSVDEPPEASELANAQAPQASALGKSEIVGGAYDWGVRRLFEHWGHSYEETKGLTFCAKAGSVGLRCREDDKAKPAVVASSYPQLIGLSGLPENQAFAVFTWLGSSGAVLETPHGLRELSAEDVAELQLTGFLLLWR
ncbi:MAG: AAA family ATPase, partial [Gammaproteobacteria bacterium]